MKSNDTLKEITGKLKSKSFKYKLNADGKSKEIEFSKIDYVVIAFSKRDIKTYNFFQAKDNDNFIAVNELLSENEIQEARDKVNEHESSKYPGMTYEQGLADAYDHVTGGDNPTE